MLNKVFPTRPIWLPKIILGLSSLFFALLVLLNSSTVSAFQQNEAIPLFDPLAQTINSECAPIDLVIAVDQSGSMSSSDEDSTDPDDFRDEAAQLLIIELLVNQLFECPGVQHRWSVINFGDANQEGDLGEPLIVFEMHALDTASFYSGEQLDLDKITDFKNELQTQIKNVTPHLMGTDFKIPFQEALNQFGSKRAEENVKKVLVIITDGEPCARNGYSCPPVTSGGTEMSEAELTRYMNDLYSDWQLDFQNKIDLYLIPINTISNYLERPTNSTEFPDLRSYWEAMAKLIVEVQNTGRTVTKAISEVSADFLGRSEVYDLVCEQRRGTFYMPPFQSQAEIVVLKDRPTDQFTLLYETDDGSEIAIQGGEVDPPNASINPIYLPLGRSEIYVFSAPITWGEWRFEVTDCERVFIRFITNYIHPFKVSPPNFVKTFPDFPFYNENNPLKFQVRLDEENSPEILTTLARTPSFTVTAWVWHEESETIDQADPIQLKQVAGTTLFESQPGDYVKTPKDGTYSIRIAGTFEEPGVVNITSLSNYTIFDETFHFLAGPLDEFQVAIQTPQTSTRWQLNEVTLTEDLPLSLPLEFALIRPDGSLFDAEMEGITANFDVTLKYADRTETVDWQPQDGLFVATLAPPPVGLAESGDFTVKVVFTGTYPDAVYYLGNREDEVAFSGYTVTGLQPILNPITSQTIHPSFIAACPFVGGQVSEVTASAVLQVRRGDEMEVLSKDEIVQLSTASPDTFLVGKLLRADGSVVLENLAFAYDGTQFNLASPLTDLIEPGDYQFEVTLDPNGVIPGDYALIAAVSTQDFRRFNTFWTSPLTCKTGIGITTGILLAALGTFLYLISGPLQGSIKLTVAASENIVETLLLGGLKSRASERQFSTDKLKKVEIGKVIVKPTKAENDKRAIFVEILDEDGGLLGDAELSAGHREENFYGNGRIYYTGK